MKAYMDDVHFERGGSEVHMRSVREARPIPELRKIGRDPIEAANRLVVEGRTPVDGARVMGMLRITIAETLTEQKWTLERPPGSAVGFGTKVLLDANRNRSPGTQVRGGPHRVTFIDRAGKRSLAVVKRRETHRRRLFTRHVVHNIERSTTHLRSRRAVSVCVSRTLVRNPR